MLTRPFRVLMLSAAVGLVLCSGADAQRRGRTVITPETLVPEELFSDGDKRALGYPDGFKVEHFEIDGKHIWKLSERSASEMQAAATPEPTPTPDPGLMGEPAPTPVPMAEPTPEPTPTPIPLPSSSEEIQFVARVDLIRPTIITLQFTESDDQASQLFDEFYAERKTFYDLSAAEPEEATEEESESDNEGEAKPEKAYVPPLSVFKLEKDSALSKEALIYNREFNLGRAGGMRRASEVVVAKGPIYLRVNAAMGLRDGTYDGEYSNLERRAVQVAKYLLQKM